MEATEIPIHLHAFVADLVPLSLISSTSCSRIIRPKHCIWTPGPSSSLSHFPFCVRLSWVLLHQWPYSAIFLAPSGQQQRLLGMHGILGCGGDNWLRHRLQAPPRCKGI